MNEASRPAVIFPAGVAARQDERRGQQGWAVPLLALAAGLAILGHVFLPEIEAAVSTWQRSAAYNHCWLVLPVALWLAWTRRQRLVGVLPAPTPLAALPALGAGLAWLLAERLGVMEGRQFAALGVMLSLVLGVLGWRVCRLMAAPLAYLVFLVPFGAFLVPALQDITAWMIVLGLKVLDIPHHADALVIELAVGNFLVAEACAGLRFIVASLAFGALYALTMFRSPGRRLLVMVLALVVPVIANGLRALGIVLLGHYLGSAEAAAADHLVYGWVFFSVIILLLTLAGLPFREDGAEPAPVAPFPAPTPWRRSGLAWAVSFTLAGGLAAPGIAAALDRGGVAGPEVEAVALAAPDGCTGEGQGLRCGAMTLSAQILRFPTATRWSAVVAERLRLGGQEDEAVTFSIQAGARWEARQAPGSAATVAVAAWHGGAPAGDGLRARATRLWGGMQGEAGRPVLAVVALQGATSASGSEMRQARAVLRRVLEHQAEGQHPGGLLEQAREQSRGS